MCDTDEMELGRTPDVHHIVPVRLFMETPGFDASDAHFPGNLITLCVTCHRRADHGRIDQWTLWRAIDESPNPSRYPVNILRPVHLH